MSYDLYFWRQTKDMQMSHGQIIDLLCEDKPIDGVASFPRTRVRAVLKKSLPDIEDGDFDLTWEGDGSYFQIGFAHANERDVHLIIANCGYELVRAEKGVNRLIEACASLGCALYDPQTDKRYEQPEPAAQG
jgi:hypothetical protein